VDVAEIGDVNWIVNVSGLGPIALHISFMKTDSFQMMVSLDVIPCSLVDRYQNFRGTCCLRLQGWSAVRMVRSCNGRLHGRWSLDPGA
jgi:hypothetical protein